MHRIALRTVYTLLAIAAVLLCGSCTGHTERYVATRDIAMDDTRHIVHAGDTVVLDYKASYSTSLVTDLQGNELGHATRLDFKPLELRGRIELINHTVSQAFTNISDKIPQLRSKLHLPDDAHSNARLFLWLSGAVLVVVIGVSALGRKLSGGATVSLIVRIVIALLLLGLTLMSTAVMLNQFSFGDDWTWFLKPSQIGWWAAIGCWGLTALCVGVQMVAAATMSNIFPGDPDKDNLDPYFTFGMYAIGWAVGIFIFGALLHLLQSWIDARFLIIIMWWIPILLVIAAACSLLYGFTIASGQKVAAMPLTATSVLCAIIMGICALLMMSAGILLVVAVVGGLAVLGSLGAGAVSSSRGRASRGRSSSYSGPTITATNPDTGRRHTLRKVGPNTYEDTSNGERYRRDDDGTMWHIK